MKKSRLETVGVMKSSRRIFSYVHAIEINAKYVLLHFPRFPRTKTCLIRTEGAIWYTTDQKHYTRFYSNSGHVTLL